MHAGAARCKRQEHVVLVSCCVLGSRLGGSRCAGACAGTGWVPAAGVHAGMRDLQLTS
jgi:hypothetical protein